MLAYVLFVFSIAYAHGIQVDTTEGAVNGSLPGNPEYHAFYGIPYAGPTSGSNRFKAPVPPLHRTGVFIANDSNVICAQPTSRGIIGVEDCLTLNVFTRNVTASQPVIVWLNSEEYTNSLQYPLSIRTFIEKDVVFVQMNFRLSIFGFLCLRVQEAPGNAGLRDVIQGLKWIQANIHNFGGNPNNVILMGHSSGAAMVDLLTISPQTKNLVHKGIALSGSGLAPWAVAYDPIGYAKQIGAELSFSFSDKSLVNFAKHLTITNINVLNTVLNQVKFYNNTPLFAPCIENPKLNPNDTVLADAPINILRSGNYPKIPFIYGYTTLEGSMRAEEAMFGWLNTMQTNFTDFLQVDLQFGNNKTAMAQKIREFYFGSSPVSFGTIKDFLDYEGDTLVLVSVIKTATERTLSSSNDVRLLEFGYVGSEISDWLYNQVPLSGSKHGAFLNYLFDYNLKTHADENVCRSLVTRFTAFAHDWYPGPAVSAGYTDGWQAITKNTTKYLYYGGAQTVSVNKTSVKTEDPRFNPHKERMTFWNNLYAKYYVAPSKPSSSSVIVSCLSLVMLCQLLVVRLI